LRLPEEIQNRIYKLALEGDFSRCTRKKFRCTHCIDRSPRFSEPALLRTCGEIRMKAGDIWYANATFYVHDGLQHCIDFLNFLGKGRVSKLGLIKDEPSFGQKSYAELFLRNLHREAKRCGLRLKSDSVEVSYRESSETGEVEKEVALRTMIKTEKRGNVLSFSRACILSDPPVECE
jgi:hypothetical protein